MYTRLHQQDCFAYPEQNDLQLISVLGETVYLCKDCLIDYKARHHGSGVVSVIFVDQEGLDLSL